MQLPCCELRHRGGPSGTAEPVGTELRDVAGCGRRWGSRQRCILLVHKGQKSPLQQLSESATLMCKAQRQAWASPGATGTDAPTRNRAAPLCPGICVSNRCSEQINGLRSDRCSACLHLEATDTEGRQSLPA